jgi:catechol 2,3-dioxygenase-like lactoylglutathione lyase family enzyme
VDNFGWAKICGYRGARQHREVTEISGTSGGLHHVELWVPDLLRAESEWGWLLGELGYRKEGEDWPSGWSWHLGATYIVVEQSSDLTAETHDRRRPGLNHLAFHAGDTARVDVLTEQAKGHGWELMFADRHPHAGGPQHYAAFLQNTDGYEVELVADSSLPGDEPPT